MKAIIYPRVSTKKQEEFGFSLPEQTIRLKAYCDQKGYEIVGVYEEKFSAKNFHRPAFNKLINDLKTGRVVADVFICIKGDRYSRDLAAALEMLKTFNKLNLKYEQIEGGNYDLSVPENLIPFYLNFLLPEVDNKRRALNTIRGMRQARREGKWVGTALKGYKWIVIDKKSKMIFDEVQCHIIKKAFVEFATGIYKIEELRKKLLKEGLSNCSKNQFANILKNQGYIGNIYIPPFQDEQAEIVKGTHQPLIDETTFYKVQGLLSKKNVKINKVSSDLILRRYLLCDRCGNILTGSRSKSRNGQYHYYYHCNSSCGFRIRAKETNSAFDSLLKDLQAPKEVVKLYKEILIQRFQQKEGEASKRLQTLNQELIAITKMKTEAEDSFFRKEIPADVFSDVSSRYRNQLQNLEDEKVQLVAQSENFKAYLEYGSLLITNLHNAWIHADDLTKQKIVGSIFPKGITFTGSTFRTTTPNSILLAFQCKSALLEVLENEKAIRLDGFSQRALPPGLEPGTL